jgi:thioesterase domain-containing protein
MSGGSDMPVNLEQRLDRLTPNQRVLLKRRLTQDARQRSEEFSGDTDSRLVAYVVANPGVEPPASDDLRRFLSQRLPSHLIPSRFTALDAWPLLPNGKIDRAALAGRRDAPPKRDARERTTSTIERQLMRIWGDLLDVVEVGREENFFELGGHSLLLPRLMDRIQLDFGVALPLGTLFQTPTVKGLAEIIQSSNPTQAWQSLVGIRETGRRPPLYLVHGLGGEIGYFYNLAGYLNPDQPVFGLQAPMEPFTQLEAMAAQYLAEVRRHQPRGPYLLGGYCVGGCVAYEMAQQLTEAGESVQLLAIIDAVTPNLQPVIPPLGQRMRRWVRKHPREIAPALKRKLTEWLSDRRPPAPDSEVPQWYGVPPAFHEMATRHYRAVLGYAPRPYHGDVWLFRSEDDRYRHDLGWSALVKGKLDVAMIPGRHSDVLKEPHLARMARRLSTVLDALAASKG